MFRKTVLLISFFLISFILLTTSHAAFADNDRQVWRDSEGQIVHNTWGTCVRSDLAIKHDQCSSSPEQTTEQAIQHTIIAQADRTIYFEFDKTGLTKGAKQKLNTLSDRIKSADDIQSVQVEGYADRIGTPSYNEALSKERATHVRDYLVAHNTLNARVTKIRWFGKSEPSANCSNDVPHSQLIECLQPDRKVQVNITYKSEMQESSANSAYEEEPSQFALWET